MVHGSGGQFYGGEMLSRAARLQDAGFAVATFNTRGHDIVTRGHDPLRGAPARHIGNAYEILDECRYDLAAAITWLEDRGYSRIGILGFSMGAVKVVYYQAHVQDPRVAAVIAVSPVRLSHSYFLASEGAEEYQRHYQQAKELVESGQPDALFRVTFPMPHVFGAAVYIDRHGPSERYNLLHYASKVKCPLLLIAGTLETHPRLLNCARDVYDTVRGNPGAELVLMEGAEHGLPGMEDQLVDAVVQWAGRLQPAAASSQADG